MLSLVESILLSPDCTMGRHHALTLGPLNLAPYNYHLKFFCPNCYISGDLLLSGAAWARLERSILHKFAKRRAFCPATMGCLLLSAQHVHTRAHIGFFTLLSISATHRGTLCIQAGMCLLCSVRVWAVFHCGGSRYHFTLHWPPSNYSIYLLLKGCGALRLYSTVLHVV